MADPPVGRLPRPGVRWHDDVVRVVVCDDHAAQRRQLVVRLDDEDDLDVVAEATTAEDGIARCRDLVPDLLVVGIAVETLGGARTAAGVRGIVPGCAVVALVTATDEDLVGPAVRAGVTGFLGRSAVDHAARVVRSVAAGVPALPPLAAQRVLAEHHALFGDGDSGSALDERASAVLASLAVGQPYGGAAKALGLPLATVRNLAAGAVEEVVRGSRRAVVAAAAGAR